jgi:hypothetical protein
MSTGSFTYVWGGAIPSINTKASINIPFKEFILGVHEREDMVDKLEWHSKLSGGLLQQVVFFHIRHYNILALR